VLHALCVPLSAFLSGYSSALHEMRRGGTLFCVRVKEVVMASINRLRKMKNALLPEVPLTGRLSVVNSSRMS